MPPDPEPPEAMSRHLAILRAMDAIAGALLIGTWASSVSDIRVCLLYTAELYQAVYYYQHFKNDPWRLKTLVLVTFSIDTVALLNDYACVYLYTIKHVGDTAYFTDQNWTIVVLHWQTIPVYVFTTTIVAAPVQTFLVARYWKFAHKHVITLFLSLLILAGFGGSFTCGLMVALFPAFKDRFRLKIPAILWLVTEAAADLGIAAALLWEFLRTRPTSTQTRNLVNRLATVTLQTGTATATIAVAALVGYLLNEESNSSSSIFNLLPALPTFLALRWLAYVVGVGFAWCLGRTLTSKPLFLFQLSNLNVRKSARLWTPSTSKAATSTTLGTVAFAQPGTEMDTNLSRPYAHRTATVHIESQQDLHPGSITIKSSTQMHGPEHTTDIEMGPLSWRKEEEELNFNTWYRPDNRWSTSACSQPFLAESATLVFGAPAQERVIDSLVGRPPKRVVATPYSGFKPSGEVFRVVLTELQPLKTTVACPSNGDRDGLNGDFRRTKLGRPMRRKLQVHNKDLTSMFRVNGQWVGSKKRRSILSPRSHGLGKNWQRNGVRGNSDVKKMMSHISDQNQTRHNS
ncbi:hypothetical protein C8J57DRAFT_1227059 [Mycena rebaudengoi]|nr:hypothetical protein C8J57DRAFT_1227059 [Mycena rebaudengoi]